MHPMRRVVVVGLAIVVVAVVARNTWADGGASTRGGKGTPENMVAIRVVGVQLAEDYATFHAPDPGFLQMLTFNVSASGSGAGTLRLGLVRDLSDGGVESLCDVNIPCTTAPQTHIHPDAGTCNNAQISDGEHLSISPIEGSCGNYPDGTLMATFLWE